MPKRNWWRDKLRTTTFTEESWNEMYQKAEKGEESEEVKDWNELYNTVDHADDPDVIEWNKNCNGEIVADDSSDDVLLIRNKMFRGGRCQARTCSNTFISSVM